MHLSNEVWAILGVGAPVVGGIYSFLIAGWRERRHLNDRFDKFNERFDKIHEELMSFHGRIVRIETKLETKEG